MTTIKLTKPLLAAVSGALLLSGSAMAQQSLLEKSESAAGEAGQKIDSSMSKVGNFMDDSAITARVKAALVDEKNIKSTDISVKTDNRIVQLSGSVESIAQSGRAESIAQGVEGVTGVKNDLQVK